MSFSKISIKKVLITLIATTFSFTVLAQDFSVLIFHKTNGYRHGGAITEGIKMIKDLGDNNGWTTDDTQDASKFTTANLANYDVVIWANTSGDNLLNGNQKTAFENYIKNGGGFVGIHAATDTYRDKSWPWYNDLVGAIVQTGPNHTSNNTNGTMDVVDKNHEIVNHLGNTWTKDEEWYYWELNGGYIYSGNNNLLEVRSTGNKSYDKKRPISWYKNYDGGRSFYTALGHNGTDYKSDSDFGVMIKKAILWAAKDDETTDNCPNDPNKTEPGTCGCGNIDEPNCGVSFAIPGIIEAEKFNTKSADIKIETGGSGQNIGFIQNTSFTEYKVAIIESGKHDFTVNASANTTNGGTVSIFINNQLIESINITSTGGWANYMDFSKTIDINTSGEKSLRLEYTTSNNYAFNIDQFKFEKATVTGSSNDLINTDINIYPNPANQFLEITNTDKKSTYTVLDNQMKALIRSSVSKINVSNLSNGNYWLKIESKNGVQYKQFVKQ